LAEERNQQEPRGSIGSVGPIKRIRRSNMHYHRISIPVPRNIEFMDDQDNCDCCCEGCEMNTSNIFWTNIERDKILEVHVPGYSKEDLRVFIEDDILWVESKDDQEITYGIDIPEGYEDPEECTVRDGIVTVLFRGPSRNIKELKIT
jgi:hypothetical protein